MENQRHTLKVPICWQQNGWHMLHFQLHVIRDPNSRLQRLCVEFVWRNIYCKLNPPQTPHQTSHKWPILDPKHWLYRKMTSLRPCLRVIVLEVAAKKTPCRNKNITSLLQNAFPPQNAWSLNEICIFPWKAMSVSHNILHALFGSSACHKMHFVHNQQM